MSLSLQASLPTRGQSAKQRHRTEELLTKEIAFIDHPSFKTVTWQKVCAFAGPFFVDEAGLAGEGRTPLLTRDAEAHLFFKMNYLKYRANCARVRLSARQPDPHKLRLIEQCLSEAAQARQLLTESNQRLVAGVARKMESPLIEFDDLMSEGCLILLNAIDKFDCARGFRFSTYATHALQRHYYRLLHRRQRQHGAEFHADVDRLHGVQCRADDESTDGWTDESIRQVFHELEHGLSESERTVLAKRFGLADGRFQTLAAIARELGQPKERVRVLQRQALRRLRQHAADAST